MIATRMATDESLAVLHCVTRAARRALRRSVDADDVVGDVLLQWWQRRRQTLTPISFGWLWRVTMRHAIRQRRMGGARSMLSLDQDPAAHGSIAVPGDAPDRDGRANCRSRLDADRGLNSCLTRAQYEVLSRVRAGMGLDEIARDLGVVRRTVRTLLARAADRLRRRFQNPVATRTSSPGEPSPTIPPRPDPEQEESPC